MKNLLIRMPLREKPFRLHSMRKNHTFFYRTMLPAVILSLLLTACRKDDDGPKITPPPPTDYTVLPPITEEGKNTFGCLVDGEVWVARVEGLSLEYDISAQLREKNLSGRGAIGARVLSLTQNDLLEMNFSSTFFTPKSFTTLDTPSLESNNWFSPTFRRGNTYFLAKTGDTSNHLTITKIDTVKNFISGQFECTLYNSPTYKIKITQGRFDVPYYPE